MPDVKLVQHYDGTVSIEVGEYKYLRKITASAEFDITSEAYYWGNAIKACEMLLQWQKQVKKKKDFKTKFE